ncbi:hypothetical protein BGX27_002456 [Mortierella sp. AM989]|nr:hypothetical protein BGX27_002456 [Mortierella sp. AM989]
MQKANPYARVGEPLSPVVSYPPGLDLNSYFPWMTGSQIYINVQPKTTNIIHNGVRGLFGELEDELEYTVSTSAFSQASMESCSWIDVVLSTVSLNDTQILITSIPSAFADWGGAFSAAWAAFYFFFGTPRLDPFGVISRLIRRRTQRSITKFYGYWSSDALPSKPQWYMPKDSTLPRTSRYQRSSHYEKTAHCMGDTTCKVSSSASSIIPVQDVVDISEKGQQGEYSIQAQAECIHKVERLEADFIRLHGLLKEYYLEMDLTNAEELPQTDEQRWYNRLCLPKSDAGGGKNNPIFSLIVSKDEIQ